MLVVRNTAFNKSRTFFRFKMSTLSCRNVSSASLLAWKYSFRESLSPRPVTLSANCASRFSASSISRSPLVRSLVDSNTSDSMYNWKISLHAYKSDFGCPPGMNALEKGEMSGVEIVDGSVDDEHGLNVREVADFGRAVCEIVRAKSSRFTMNFDCTSARCLAKDSRAV